MHNINYSAENAKTTRNAATMSGIKPYRLSAIFSIYRNEEYVEESKMNVEHSYEIHSLSLVL